MKITKFVHSCLLVEMPEPVNRTVLFDPGVMSEAALDVEALEFLDDVVITHIHPDHLSVPLMKALMAKFPEARITAPNEVVALLAQEGITASAEAADGMTIFKSPHEKIRPFADADPPEQIGIHYLELLSDPGDSHSFTETMPVLAMPMQAPWGSFVDALRLVLDLQPKYVLPIHDWHWSDEARHAMYRGAEEVLTKHNITFVPLKTGEPVVLDV